MAKPKLPRTEMPLQDEHERIKNYNEVALGYTAEMAKGEADRCIQCKNPTCEQGCPARVPIKDFIALVSQGDFVAAAQKIKEQNSLPAVCGRVCPQEEQCEKTCVLTKKWQPVAIGRLERFVADYERETVGVCPAPVPPPNGQKVAVVGAGPAGITAAGDLVKLGYKVTMFEALHIPGGVLMYGIPEFRLPKAVVQAEIDCLRSMGVDIICNAIVGATLTVDELFEDGYDAVFLGTGAGLPKFMNIPGESLNGVYSANEFLTRVNLMKAYRFPDYDTPIRAGQRVAVIGGGNTAMDGLRCARRLPGVVEVHSVYRRSREEMPARKEEIDHAGEEGIIWHTLCNPLRIIDDGNGWVKGLECVEMELGEPDESGRRRPVEKKGSNFVIECDSVIMAIGQGPNPLIVRTTPGLETNKWNCVVASSDTGVTSREGVYAAGDLITGGTTVIQAIGQGKVAAAGIDEYLKNKRGVA